jgi:hypothetical protein
MLSRSATTHVSTAKQHSQLTSSGNVLNVVSVLVVPDCGGSAAALPCDSTMLATGTHVVKILPGSAECEGWADQCGAGTSVLMPGVPLW